MYSKQLRHIAKCQYYHYLLNNHLLWNCICMSVNRSKLKGLDTSIHRHYCLTPSSLNKDHDTRGCQGLRAGTSCHPVSAASIWATYTQTHGFLPALWRDVFSVNVIQGRVCLDWPHLCTDMTFINCWPAVMTSEWWILTRVLSTEGNNSSHWGWAVTSVHVRSL